MPDCRTSESVSPKSLMKIAQVTDRPTDWRVAQLKVMTDKNNDKD